MRPQDDQRADLEASSQTVEFIAQRGSRGILGRQQVEGNEQFCGDPVAPAFGLVAADLQGLRVGNARTSQPEMGQLVRESEHLCSLGVLSVDEDQRRGRIRQGEAAEFLRIEAASTVAADHAADHDEHAKRIRLSDRPSQCVGPGRDSPALRDVEAEKAPHADRDFGDVVLGSSGAHEVDRFSSRGPHELAIPVLPLLAEIDGIEQIGAWPIQACVAHGAEIGNRNVLDRRLAKKQAPDRREGRPGETLELLERRPNLTPLPGIELGGTGRPAHPSPNRRVGAPSAAARVPHRCDPSMVSCGLAKSRSKSAF